MVASGRDLGSFDFSNPFMSAIIISPEGVRLPIWLNNAGSASPLLDATSLSPEIDVLTDIPYLAELTIENQLGNIPIITAVLTPPYREGLMILDSRAIEWGLSSLECQLGYVAGAGPSSISPIYRGIILKPQIEIGTETRITFNAQGVGGFISSRNVFDKTTVQTRGAHLTEIAARSAAGNPQYRFEVDFTGVPVGSTADELLLEKISFSGRSRSNWESIQKLAHEAQCYLVHDTKESRNLLRLIARAKVFSESSVPVATLTAFDYDGTFGPEVGVFPILTAASPTTAVYLPAAIGGLQNKGVSTQKENKKDQSTAATSNVKGMGPIGDNEHVAQAGQKATNNLPTAYDRVDAPRAEAERQARADSYKGHIGIRLEIETLGFPTIFPADIVRVRGLGKRLCGDGGANYMVMKVIHTYTSGGFTTSLDLISNASDPGENARAGKRLAVNEQETREGAGDSTDIQATVQ